MTIHLSKLYKTYAASLASSPEFLLAWGDEPVPDFIEGLAGGSFDLSKMDKRSCQNIFQKIQENFKFQTLNNEVHSFFIQTSLDVLKFIKIVDKDFTFDNNFGFSDISPYVSRQFKSHPCKFTNNDAAMPISNNIIFKLSQKLKVNHYSSYIEYTINCKMTNPHLLKTNKYHKYNFFTLVYYRVHNNVYYKIVGISYEPEPILNGTKKSLKELNSNKTLLNPLVDHLFKRVYEMNFNDFCANVGDGKINKDNPITKIAYMTLKHSLQCEGTLYNWIKFYNIHYEMNSFQFLTALFDDTNKLIDSFTQFTKEYNNIYAMMMI